jgi:hypothetical protein
LRHPPKFNMLLGFMKLFHTSAAWRGAPGDRNRRRENAISFDE